MKYKYILLGLVLLVSGCRGELPVIMPTETISPSPVSSTSVPEAHEGVQHEATDQEEGVITPQASMIFKGSGKIGGYAIHGTFDLESKTGMYYYDRYKTPIELIYSVENVYIKEVINNRQYIFYENEKGDTYLNFVMRDENCLQGIWHNQNGDLPFYLIREGSENMPPILSEEALAFDGDWTGENHSYFVGSRLNVKVLFDDLITFNIEAVNGANCGGVGGFAFRTSAEEAFVCTYGPPEEEVYFKFSIDDEALLNLESSDYTYGCGYGAMYDTTYLKGFIRVPLPSALEVGIVKDEEEEARFKALVGNHYAKFIEVTQGVQYSEVPFEEGIARVSEAYFRGMQGFAFYMIAGPYMYMGVIDDKTEYYTNDSRYKTTYPEPMKAWMQSRGILEQDIVHYYVPLEE